MDDIDLLKRAEEALAEINRTQGLADNQAEVLAAIRMRLYGSPGQTLDDAIKAAGDLQGKPTLDQVQAEEKTGSLDDALQRPKPKREWPGA